MVRKNFRPKDMRKCFELKKKLYPAVKRDRPDPQFIGAVSPPTKGGEEKNNYPPYPAKSGGVKVVSPPFVGGDKIVSPPLRIFKRGEKSLPPS